MKEISVLEIDGVVENVVRRGGRGRGWSEYNVIRNDQPVTAICIPDEFTKGRVLTASGHTMKIIEYKNDS